MPTLAGIVFSLVIATLSWIPAGFSLWTTRVDNPACRCEYQQGGAGTDIPNPPVSWSCDPTGGASLWVESDMYQYTAHHGRCQVLPDCTDEADNCTGSGKIEAETNSPCRLSIVLNGTVKAVAYGWVATEFDDDLVCGETVTYNVCVGSVPIRQHTNRCFSCGL